MEVRPLTLDERTAWESLVRSAPEATIYHSAAWLQAVSRAVGDTPLLLGLYDQDALVGGMPFQCRRRGPLRLLRRGFATPYSGLVLRDCLARTAAASAFGRAFRGFMEVRISASPFAAAPLPFQGSRCPRATYLFPPEPSARQWRRFAPEVRNRIRKAEKAGVVLTETLDVAAFFRLYAALYEGKGRRVPFSASSFQQFLHEICAAGLGRLYLASTSAGLCAAALILHDARRGYYSLAASDPQLRKTGAASLLIWQVLQDCAAQGRVFDFGGANIPAVAEFKRKFGGRLHVYEEVCLHRNRIEGWLLGAYQRRHRTRGV